MTKGTETLEVELKVDGSHVENMLSTIGNAFHEAADILLFGILVIASPVLAPIYWIGRLATLFYESDE